MTETAEVIRFKAGDVVPDWLLVIEPEGRDRATLRFTEDTMVLDVIDCMVAIPLCSGTSVFTIDGGGNGSYYSDNKQVRIATQQTRFLPAAPLPDILWKLDKAKPSAWWRRFWPFGPRR